MSLQGRLEPEQPRVERYVCDCDCHDHEDFSTAARWEYSYGPEVSQALCTDCMLTRLTGHDDIVRTWHHHLRKLIRSAAELADLGGGPRA